MNTYYYSGTSDEVETILHDGFVVVSFSLLLLESRIQIIRMMNF